VVIIERIALQVGEKTKECYRIAIVEVTETIATDGREISVILPPSYSKSGTQRFPILLMLSPEIRAHESINHLHTQGFLPEMVVAELLEVDTPADPLVIMSELAGRFRLIDSPSAHWLCGTGHAAVSAFRALLDHPEVFGAACCLSTSFEGLEGAPPPHSQMLLDLEKSKSLPAGSRIFLDYGTVGLDECYEPYHRDLGAILRGKGWRDGEEFKINRHPGGSQETSSYRQRVGPALRWLARR